MMLKQLSSNMIAGLLLLVGVGCSEEFEPFTEVTKLRVLAIQAEPAELSPGDVGRLNALVAADDDVALTYQWRWCPVATSAITGHECPVTEEMLLAAIAQNTGVAFALPPGVSLFDLGTAPTAAFPFVIDANVLQLACTQLVNQAGDELPFLPDCEGKLETSVKLVVSDGSDEVVAVKTLNLLLNDTLVANQNPSLGTLEATESTGGGVLLVDGESTLFEHTEYELSAAIAPQVSEPFESIDVETGDTVTEKESLFMTWFISGGETAFGRTSFIPGETDFDKLRVNSWWTPDAAESGGEATVYLVLQDERGGVSWISRTVQLQER